MKIAIVGIGALGTEVAKLLKTEKLTLIDRDVVERANLPHQALFKKKDIGSPKAIAAMRNLRKSNITAVVADLTHRNCATILKGHSVILDCTDNMDTRFLINDFCKKHRIPWVHAAVIRNAGTLWPILPAGPCFACIFTNHAGAATCDTAGVTRSIVQRIAEAQAATAKKLLNKLPINTMMLRMSGPATIALKPKQRKNCRSCNRLFDYLNGKAGTRTIKLCGSNSYQVRGRKLDLKKWAKKAKHVEGVLHYRGITLFEDGRALIKAKSEADARSKYARMVG